MGDPTKGSGLAPPWSDALMGWCCWWWTSLWCVAAAATMLACPAGIDRDCMRPAWAFGLMVGCSGAAAAEGGAAAGAAAAGAWDSCIRLGKTVSKQRVQEMLLVIPRHSGVNRISMAECYRQNYVAAEP